MFWSIDTAGGFTQVNMTNIGDTFRANIPAQPLKYKSILLYISYISKRKDCNKTASRAKRKYSVHGNETDGH